MSLDVNPTDRTFGRLLACFGLRNDSAAVFEPGCTVAGAGVLFAIPLLVHSGIFRLSHKL